MFRKLISNLPFSPALVGQLGFYAKRLRKEEATRRVGLVFIALALIVQSFAVFSPPSSANASSDNDFVPGGLGLGSSRSLQKFLTPYDQNSNHLQDIMNYFGITRAEIAAAQFTSWSTPGKLSWGHNPMFSYAQGERSVSVTNASGKALTTVYGRPMTILNGNSQIYGWVGHSAKIGWFAIMQACGNLVTTVVPTPPKPVPTAVATAVCSGLTVSPITRTSDQLEATGAVKNGARVTGYTYTVKNSAGSVISTKTNLTAATSNTTTVNIGTVGTYSAQVVLKTSIGDVTSAHCVKSFTVAPPAACPLQPSITVENSECQPCAGDSTIWVKSPLCTAQIVETKTAYNQDQQKDATTVVAEGSQKIQYTITAQNQGKLAAAVVLQDNLADTLQYATLVDNGGGNFDSATNILSWGSVTLKPGQSTSRSFVVQVINPVPATAQGTSDPTSYDCVMTNTFGTSTNVKVDCPTPKVFETVTTALPETGASENMIVAGIVFAIAAYFYARSRQTSKEIRLIRRDLNTGTI